MTIEEFTTKKRAKLLGYVVGRYFVTSRRGINPNNFTLACFNVVVRKFFMEDWMIAVFAGEKPRFVTPTAKSEYISGFSLALASLALTQTEAEKIGVLIPCEAVIGETEDGKVSMGGLLLSRYPEAK